MVQTPWAVSVDIEAAGFDSEEYRRWREVAVRRRAVFGSWAGGFVESAETLAGVLWQTN